MEILKLLVVCLIPSVFTVLGMALWMSLAYMGAWVISRIWWWRQ